jgi:acetolactate synthase-1/2/3 large subunit
VNFPSSHPLYLGTNPTPFVEAADALLIVDSDVPYIPSAVQLARRPKIIHMDIDPIKQTIPLWGFPVDICIHADSSKGIPALRQAVVSRLTIDDQTRIAARTVRVEAQHRTQEAQWLAAARSSTSEHPIAVEWLCSCIGEVMDENTLIVDETVTNTNMTTRYIRSTAPGTYFQSGASSLGWGPGAALGAKLASPDKTVVSLVGDGSFIFSDPIAPLWAADVYGAPFLIVVFNNQEYYAPKRALKEAYPASFSERMGRWIGMDISPSPDYRMIGEACRAYGETVTQPEQVKPALLRALEEVRQGRAAVLDVIIGKP